MVVDSTDALDDVLGPLLVEYGGRHAHLDGGRGFRPEFWDLFADALCAYAHTAGWSRRDGEATLAAWRTLVDFVVAKVKQGYCVERLDMQRQPH